MKPVSTAAPRFAALLCLALSASGAGADTADHQYRQYCANCHSAGTARPIAEHRPDEKLAEASRDGLPDRGMPPFGALFPDQEIRALAGVVRARSGRGMTGATIEAETLNRRLSASYLVTEAETHADLHYVGYFDFGSTLCYDNVDMTGVRSIEFEYARGMDDPGRFAILVGDSSGFGPRTNLGESATASTGGWETYQRRRVGLSGEVGGLHLLCFLGIDGGGIFNLDKFTLNAEPGENDGVTLTFDAAPPGEFSDRFLFRRSSGSVARGRRVRDYENVTAAAAAAASHWMTARIERCRSRMVEVRVTRPAVMLVSSKTAGGHPTLSAAADHRHDTQGSMNNRASSRPLRQTQTFDLDEAEWYLNRELTWLEFNRRVLNEAADPRTPLLERVNFLSIVSSNLDEFFMKRIGGLKQQIGAGVDAVTVDGRTPQQQIDESIAIVQELLADQTLLLRELIRELSARGIHLHTYGELEPHHQKWLRQHYFRNIFPLVTPLAIDPLHPFPFVSNLSVNVLVEVKQPSGERSLVRIKTPVSDNVSRFVRLGDDPVFVPLEQLISENLDLLLPGTEVENVYLFRVIRNAIAERDGEQANDLLELIRAELRERKFAPVVRLEVSRSMPERLRSYLSRHLGLTDSADIAEVDELLGRRDLAEIARLAFAELRYPPHAPADHPRLKEASSVFAEVRRGPLLLQHPYQSFTGSITRLLREAVDDPDVLAIKMTLYRTSADSQVIPLLAEAAARGKQVAVVLELQARFDEAANIQWADRLEEAGIHLSYGVVGYKTHAKMILILRRETDGLRRYVHVGTGNYHSGTASQYCDVCLLSCEEDLGADATELFNSLTTGTLHAKSYRKLVIAPLDMKEALLGKIEREIRLHTREIPGLIQLKTNALEDKDITKSLYRASQAGVHVDLIVRDTCRLRPGIPGLSENINVISIIGRFLEHSRIYYFRNGGTEEYYIGSADCMARNLTGRVETLAPIEHPSLMAELRIHLDLQLADRRSVWEMQPDGCYVQRVPEHEQDVSAQNALIERAAIAGAGSRAV